jgi:hypothetical protein
LEIIYEGVDCGYVLEIRYENAQASLDVIHEGIACGHPSELLPIAIGIEKQITQEKYSSKLGYFSWVICFIRDRGGIRTPNPQSRNLIFYPVELRSHFGFGVRM